MTPVGYGRPPAEHQFVKGASGNPSGRAKVRPATFAETLQDVLELPVHARLEDRAVKLTTFEAMFLKLCKRALTGDRAAMKVVFNFIAEAERAIETDPARKPIDIAAAYRRLAKAWGVDPDAPSEPLPPETPEDAKARKARVAKAVAAYLRKRGPSEPARRRLFGA